LIGAEASLGSLLAASFIAATLVPMSSEAVLFGVLKFHPELFWAAIATATLGNTLGGMTTYLIGRVIGNRKPLTQLDRVKRYGAPLLALAWLPVVGDAFCLAAGWVKLNWCAVLAWSAAGRALRYWVVAEGTLF
jgi:membrane protein YqaA with SNARE-associated domain